MSKEKFVERVMSALSEEYGLTGDQLAPHRASIEAAADTEAAITEGELNQLMSGHNQEVQDKYPLLNAVSLAIVEGLDEDEEVDDEDDDDDDDEDEDEEDEDDDDDGEDE